MNYYELLGVDSNASSEDIKNAYKNQMKKWHPDINKDSEAVSMSMKINEAKDVLLDENKRKEYDDFLRHKEDEVYKRYSSSKSSTSNDNYSKYSSHMVTKWEYLKEYLNSNNISLINKIFSVIFVSLESLFCFILKWFIIFLAFISFSLSDIIFMLFYYLFPVIALLFIIVIYNLISTGYENLVTNHVAEVRGIFIFILAYFFSYVFIFVGKKLVSQKVFNFLYNKLDIYLFKKAVFYKN